MNTSADTAPLSVNAAREQVYEAVDQGFNEDYPVLIDALPSSGKSYSVIKWAADTGNPLTVFTARHDLYEQYTDWAEERNLRCKTLPSFHKDCPTANGEHGKKWQKQVTKKYRQIGLLPGEIHQRAGDLFDEELPCQREGDCSYFSAREINPEEFDVLIGHYRHAHVPERVNGRYVAFDEFPEGDFLQEYDATTVTKSVSTYLERNDDLPFSYLKDLKEQRWNPKKKSAGVEWFDQHNPALERDVDGAVEEQTRNGQPEAPAMVYAILVAETLENRWEYAKLGDGCTVVISPNDDSLTILNRPTLDQAESIIALDGTPTVEKWRLMLGEDLQHDSLMSGSQKQSYLRDTLSIRVTQTTDAAKHYSARDGRFVTPNKDLVLFENIGYRENIRPALITSKAALEKYNENGLSEIIGETEHYGNLKGTNKFAKTRVGIVAGSPNYGFDYIKRWSALAGESVEESRDENGKSLKGMEQDFGDYGNKILYGMRENEVLQAILRFGRDGKGASVYVHTAAIPEWVKRDSRVVDIHSWPSGMEEIFQVIRQEGRPEWRTKDVSSKVSITEQQVRDHLHTLVDFGFISVKKKGRGYLWSDVSTDKIQQRGHIIFES